MMGGWVLFWVLTQAPIGPVPEGFATEGVLRSGAHRRRVLEAALPSNSSLPFVFTDSGETRTRLELTVPGIRGSAVLDSTGTSVEWPGAGADQPFSATATVTQVTFTFIARQKLYFNFTGQVEVKGNTATLSLQNGPSYFVIAEGSATWTGYSLEVVGVQQPARVHVGLMVTRQRHAEAETPPPVWGAAMAWDERNQRLVRYGGTSAPATLPGDYFADPQPDLRTWVLDDHVGWRSLTLPNPGERVRPTMVWDRRRATMVLFGGATSSTILNDTWELSDAGWQEIRAFGPTPRWAHAMAFDVSRGRAVLVGGSNHSMALDESWDWDGNLWSRLSTSPGSRDALGMTWDENLQAMLLFGGWRNYGTLGDTWALQGGSWTQLMPTSSPPPRSSLAMAWDPVRHQTIMTGGWNPAGALFMDTWAFDGSRWTQLPDAPQPWYRHVLASHPRLGVVGFGGAGNAVAMSDTWYLADAGWRAVPLKAADGPCFFDPVEQRVGLFMDGSQWTLGPREWERTRDSPFDVIRAARTPEGVVAVSRTNTWIDRLDGGPIESLDAGAQPEAAFLFWDEVLARLWLLTPGGDLYTLTQYGWDLRAVLGPGVRSAAPAPDGGLLVLETDIAHYDPITDSHDFFCPAPPPGPGPTTLYFDRRRELVVAVRVGADAPLTEWDGTGWTEIETAHFPLEFIGARDAGTPVARGGDGDAIIEYEQLRARGARCAEARQCASGFCADGRCCESACSGTGDCLACSLEAGGSQDGVCTTIRIGYELVCASAAPCLESVCVPQDPSCPPLNDLKCPIDSGTPQPRDAGRPSADAGEEPPSPPKGCGCTGWPDAIVGCVLLLALRRQRHLANAPRPRSR